jgi:hypothetical protein
MTGELIGVVIPVTRSLVTFLIEQNISRVLYNIGLSEKRIRALDKMTTLEEAFYRAGQLIDKAATKIFLRPLPPIVRSQTTNRRQT